jgi:nitroreductase
METAEVIHKRCSLKTHLSSRPIEAEKIDAIVNAARLAPSARNTQPWRFIVVEGEKAVDALVDAAFSERSSMIRQAPAIIIVCARPADDVTIDGQEYYLFDVGLAVENMVLAATDLGLVTHLIASFNEVELKRILHTPDDVRVVIATPLAYPLEGSYDEAAKDRLSQRTRKPLHEVAYAGKWGNLADG